MYSVRTNYAHFIKSSYCRIRQVVFYSSHFDELEVTFSNGRKMHISTGKMARLADGCAVARIGSTNVMAVAVSGEEPPAPRELFMPLTVEYRQKSASAAKIPTNYNRRDTLPTEREILTGRLIDRSVRVAFPKGFCSDTQITANLLSLDGIHEPDIAAINAASAALHLSNIPWNGPVGAVKFASFGKDIVINPTRREVSDSDFTVVVAVNSRKNIVMLEGQANKPTQQPYILKCIKAGMKDASIIIDKIEKYARTFAKPKRPVKKNLSPTNEVIAAVQTLASLRFAEILKDHTLDKKSRDQAINLIKEEVTSNLRESFPEESSASFAQAISDVIKFLACDLTLKTGKRVDGRGFTELRSIECQVDMFSPLHGSAIFTRGQTQVLSTLTLDSLEKARRYDPVSVMTGAIKEKNFMLQYEFPQYAVNDVGRPGVITRREIGHGALAEKGLKPVMPSDFPFTTKLNCEVLESNGSSSMASVCAGSLALLDAGIPIESPVAGVALGLMIDEQTKQFAILTDILGFEDFMGSMDFKIAGTKKAITAFQMDIKYPEGVNMKVVTDAIIQSSQAHKEILEIMANTIDKPNEINRLKWPVREEMEVPAHKRSRLLGVGGINLKKLENDLDVEINQDRDNPNIFIVFSPNHDAHKEAIGVIKRLIEAEDFEKKLEFKGVYPAKIVEVLDSGVKVIFYPNMNPAFLPNRELDMKVIQHPSVLGFKVGDEINVKYFGRDPATGSMRLSRRAIQVAIPRTSNLLRKIESDLVE